MVQMKTEVLAIVAASSLLWSTAVIEAADRESAPSALPAAAQQQFHASITQAMAMMATLPVARGSMPTALAGKDKDQDQPQGRLQRVSQSSSCRLPSWLKYSLISAAAAGSGFALSQAVGGSDRGEHGGHGLDGSHEGRR
jgi:hypothetical protein